MTDPCCRLIMILVIGDLIRSIWFFIIPLINLVRGPVESHTDFCQVSGFFLQVGIETAGKFLSAGSLYLTYESRLRHLGNCHTYIPPGLQANYRRIRRSLRDWSLQVALCDLCGCCCHSILHVLTRFHPQKWRLLIPRPDVFIAFTPFLVPSGNRLDPALHDPRDCCRAVSCHIHSQSGSIKSLETTILEG